jgi:hypothetical protein
MAPHTHLAPVLIAAACVIGTAPAVLAQTRVEAKTWDDAIFKLDCKDIKKNADGSFSITAVVKIKNEEHHNPIVNVPEYKSEIEAKKC